MSIEQDSQGSSTRPYLIRALHDWCTDNGFTPYLAVYVDRSVQVPQEYVKNNEIVLNVSFEATSQLQLGNEFVEFKARFGGVARDISVPVDHVIAIYARENGQGMAFPVPTPLGGQGVDSPASAPAGDDAHLVDAEVQLDAGASPGAGTPAAGGLRLAPAQKAPRERPSPVKAVDKPAQSPTSNDADPQPPEPPTGGGRPALRRVK
ncbi:ClpXP protease specificity-enhancing factor [uncultured Aquabacterium sp.]|jgi:stringent starvation protein B|uniref:ClpXP protease specificity-enhancing factor n=1 Tax=Aquabacterium commune TaxID=70586 RepID=UPI0030CB30EC|tara:strand:- start:3059 stop:3676 length:618 start_codon:yes stop_codon:yes gene_type:complete